MPSVAIIDSGLCNVDSVGRALEEVGGRPYVVHDGASLGEPDYIVLPGVGAFPEAMARLRGRDLDKAIADEALGTGVPVLGICLGMQLLATRGFEGGETSGLDWIHGDVVRLEPTDHDPRVPHVGWNEVYPTDDSPLFEGVEPGTDFYFVHSFRFVPTAGDDTQASTPYCGGFTSAVGHGVVFGVQFHPEKSQRAGFQVLRNFLAV
jgi:glutamine amidotransferase